MRSITELLLIPESEWTPAECTRMRLFEQAFTADMLKDTYMSAWERN